MEPVATQRRPDVRSASLGHVTADLRHPGLDAIRFASYRTAAKLRYVQKRTNMHLVDIWNIIEAFRENALNTLDAYTDVKVSRLETLISTLYHSLNKRLATEQKINVAASTTILLNWLLAAYDRNSAGQVQVFSVKVALVTLCNSKPLDKLRYIFSQISDSNGHLGHSMFSEYLKEALTLPAAVYESPSFPFNEHLAATIFDGVWRINVNDFLDVLLSEPGPDCLTWLPLLHRLAQSESVVHVTSCDACRRDNFTGLRYKCDTCSNYNLCQDCFWLGRISAPHELEHPVKEYMTPHPSRPLSMSMRRSLRCIPSASTFEVPRFPETPEPTLDLTHIVPAVSHGAAEEGPNSCDSWSSNRSFPGSSYPDWANLDDEHRLIAHYAQCLAMQHINNTPGDNPTEGAGISPSCLDSFRVQKELIQELEVKNREITKEINRIKEQTSTGCPNPGLASELRSLRGHKNQLEGQLTGLQDSRKQLMQQLELLMSRLKSQSGSGNKANHNNQHLSNNHNNANNKISPNSNTISSNSTTMHGHSNSYGGHSTFANNALNMSMTSLATSGTNTRPSPGMGSQSGLSNLGLSGSTMGLANYGGIGGSQTGLSSIGMGSGGNGLTSLGFGFGGSSTGLSTIGLGSSGLSGSNLGLSNLGLASLAGFGQMQMGGSQTGLSGLGIGRQGGFGGSREQIYAPGMRGMGGPGTNPFSRDVPGYPQRGDSLTHYSTKRDGPPPPVPPRDCSIAGTITAAPPPMSYSAPATPSHSTSGGTGYDSLSNMQDPESTSARIRRLSSANSGSEESDNDDQVRSDLLIAADSVTTAMSSLVRELNSESSDDEVSKKKAGVKRASKGDELKWPVLSSQDQRGSNIPTGRGRADGGSDRNPPPLPPLPARSRKVSSDSNGKQNGFGHNR